MIATVVIPTYRRPDRIVRAVLSALNQTCTDIEVIVVDDNGKNTKEAIQTEEALSAFIHENRITYIQNEKNSGGSFSRNQGLKIAKGEYISFLDDDDEILPQKIEKQVSLLDRLGENYSACYCAYHKITPDGKVYKSNETIQGDVYRYALARSIYVGSGSNLLVRTDLAKEIGGYDVSFKRNQDLEFLTRIIENRKLAYLSDDLLTIHYEIREVQRSYEQMIAVDAFYFDSFKDRIQQLPESQQRAIYETEALERFRYSISKKHLSDGISNLFKKNVRFSSFCRYVFYLINRIANKISYGVKL